MNWQKQHVPGVVGSFSPIVLECVLHNLSPIQQKEKKKKKTGWKTKPTQKGALLARALAAEERAQTAEENLKIAEDGRKAAEAKLAIAEKKMKKEFAIDSAKEILNGANRQIKKQKERILGHEVADHRVIESLTTAEKALRGRPNQVCPKLLFASSPILHQT